MVYRIWIIVLVVAVPVFGYLVSSWIQGEFDSELRMALIEAYPDADEMFVQEITLTALCDDPDTDLVEVCSTYSNLELMRSGSVIAGISGLILIVITKLAGLLARISRRVLLVVFKPGLYFTAVVLVGLVLVHALIAIGSLWYIGSWIGRIPIGFIGLIGIGGFVGVLVLANNMLRIVKKAQTSVIGFPLSRDRAPDLYRNIESIAQRLGALAPHNIVIGLDPNFFVTEANVECLGDKLTGRTLYCSLPLCRIMSVGEFDAVIGHELGHFKGLDTKFSEKFYPIYRGTATSLAMLQQNEGASSIALLPAIAVLTYFYDAFATAENTHSREREFAADNEGANASSAEILASALVKVHAFAPFWSHFQDAAIEAIQDDKFYVNASVVFAAAIERKADEDILVGIAETHTSHPTDSHPSLAARLESLNVPLQSVASQSLDVQPETPANSLICEVELLEQEISEAYQMVLAHYVKVDDQTKARNESEDG